MGDFADLVASESRGLVAGVRAAVRALPRGRAAAVASRDGADVGVGDIADALRAPVPAVRSLLDRGRVALGSEPIVQSYAERAGPS
jgi:DNA-directed RNA polymerase specialized sigma24 family protein